ncbi:MAG TPA: glycosyltransferase [Pyrinomonadaceae bacterium]|nr:glycosyltransferase [Pyrinomonadaceae bacterium]
MNEPARENSPASPKVSVITPLYNSAAFIRGTLDSLLAQTYADWESILVDDGSTDDTAEVVRPYLEDARFRYVRQENRGIAGARNTGILAAGGEWVCLLDHDDRWLSSKLEKELDHARAHGSDIVCSDAYMIVEGTGRGWLHSRALKEIGFEGLPADPEASADVFGLLIRRNFMCTCSVMLRRALFEERGLLDAEAVPADDYEMWMRCMPEAKIGFVAEPLVEYHIHGGNFSMDETRMLEKIIYVLWKHRRRHAAAPARARQFDDALVAHYSRLFEKMSEERRGAEVLRRSLALLTAGAGGARVFYGAVCAPLVARALNSIRYRTGSARF